MSKKNLYPGIVYSTEHGSICPACNNPKAKCSCGKGATRQGDGIVRIERQTKGRKGKGVSIITGLPVTSDELKKIGKTLKQKCGTGGTTKEGVIEIQGDHRQTLKTELEKLGYTTKLSGG